MIKRFFKIIKGFIGFLLLAFLAIIGLSFLPIEGNYKIYTVQSGSMEPAINMGSLIIVRPQADYEKGDIITRRTKDPKVTVTHRVTEKEVAGGNVVFTTRGDANNADDPEKANPSDVIGKMVWGVPFLGFPIGYARTMPGFILLVVIPAVIIIYEEVKNIKEEIVNALEKRKIKKEAKKRNLVEAKPARRIQIEVRAAENIPIAEQSRPVNLPRRRVMDVYRRNM